MPTNAKTKRLSVLQSNYDNAHSIERLNIFDLLLLLRHDECVQEIIRNIVYLTDSTVQQAKEPFEESIQLQTQAQIRPIPYSESMHVRAISQSDVLRTELAPELRLLNLITQDAELRRAWLGEPAESEGRQLVRLIAVASQWSQILLLWDRLAERCRAKRQPASVMERQILESSITLHNLVWDGKQARMEHTNVGSPFDHEVHERGTPTGEFIREEWLPGLLNAAGIRNKKVLAATA